jgi:hypothetical protein
MIKREKCKICGVIIEGVSKDKSRHLRLKHQIVIDRKNIIGFSVLYENAEDIDAPAVIRKSILKEKNKKDNLNRRKKYSKKFGKVKSKSVFWGAVIKTPNGSK